MTAAANVAERPWSLSLRRFFRTPKGILIVVLAILAFAAAAGAGFTRVAPVVIGGALAAMLVDAPILRYREKAWIFPDGALLTGLIVAMVLSPFEPWHVAAITAAVGVVSKYAYASGTRLFNPAAFALVATFYGSSTAQSWWGALPDLAPIAIVLLFATGIFIRDRVNKIPLVLSFLGMYYLRRSPRSPTNPAHVANLYRAPDLPAALFFRRFFANDRSTNVAT